MKLTTCDTQGCHGLSNITVSRLYHQMLQIHDEYRLPEHLRIKAVCFGCVEAIAAEAEDGFCAEG